VLVEKPLLPITRAFLFRCSFNILQTTVLHQRKKHLGIFTQNVSSLFYTEIKIRNALIIP